MDAKRKEQLDKWFDEVFWFTYPNDLAHKKKGSKLRGRQALYKLKPDDKELDRILDNTRALIRYDRHCLKKGEQVDRWPFVSSYLNGDYYDREIEGYAEVNERAESKKCDCGEKAVVLGLCLRCYNKRSGSDKRLYQFLLSRGLGKKEDESRQAYCHRMRDEFFNTFGQTEIGKTLSRSL